MKCNGSDFIRGILAEGEGSLVCVCVSFFFIGVRVGVSLGAIQFLKFELGVY